MPRAEQLLYGGIQSAEEDAEGIVFAELQNDGPHQERLDSVTAVLDRDGSGSDDVHALLNSSARVGFELGVAYGLQLNSAVFLRPHEPPRSARALS